MCADALSDPLAINSTLAMAWGGGHEDGPTFQGVDTYPMTRKKHGAAVVTTVAMSVIVPLLALWQAKVLNKQVLDETILWSIRIMATLYAWKVFFYEVADYTLNPQSSILNPQSSILNPQPSTLNPRLEDVSLRDDCGVVVVVMMMMMMMMVMVFFTIITQRHAAS